MIAEFINKYLIPNINYNISDKELLKKLYDSIDKAKEKFLYANQNKSNLVDSQIERIFSVAFGYPGIMLDGSKSDKNTIYNANLLVGGKKYWYGDFRLFNKWKLDEIATILNEKVYLLREMDARFETELNPNLDEAVYVGVPRI